MREISKEKFVSAIKELIIHASYFLPTDFLESLREAIKIEQNELAKDVLLKILDNAEIASIAKLPLCQDTGIPQFFIETNKNLYFNFDVEKTIQETVAEVYNNEKFRKSCVADPLIRQPVIHWGNACISYNDNQNEKCKISVLIRGGGCENTVALSTFLPTTDLQEIVSFVVNKSVELIPYSCPPVIVGVGIGGTVEQCMLLAKKSLLRNIGERNKHTIYAELEKQIKQRINQTGIGPLGLGGVVSTIDVFIETQPTHIATLCVGIVLQCHSYRKHTVII